MSKKKSKREYSMDNRESIKPVPKYKLTNWKVKYKPGDKEKLRKKLYNDAVSKAFQGQATDSTVKVIDEFYEKR